MSIVVRERDREREWDSDAYRDDRPRNVTVRRYKVPDRNEDDRIDTVSRHSRYDDGPRYPSNYRDTDVREYRFETDNSRGRPEAQRDLDEYRSEPGRAPEYREVRVSRAVSREPPRQEPYPYELDHYTKTTDYYARQEDPRPIVIRQDAPQPIIIREQAPQPLVIRERDSRPTSPRSVLLERQRESEREEKQSHVSKRTEIDKRSAAVDRRTEPDRRTEVDRRTEINEERTVARREEPPPPVRQEPEDEYYYQRTTRQIARDERDDYDDYRSRKEDARHRRDDDRYSDEEYRYKRIERDYGDSRHMSRSKSRHRLDVAEGAVAGLAGAALMNRKKKGKGEESGGLKNLVGGAALGAVGGEVVSRARSRFGRDHSGSRSRSRSRSYEREGRGRRHRRDHSRTPSRSGSRDRLNNIGKLAGVAVVGALAGYAASRRRGNKDEERRSRSRVRHSSRSRSTSRDSRVDEYTEDGKNSKRRNSTMAKAGLASAAAAGVVDRIRSRSRGGRSKSRVRQGLPIAAAGVGGAALAGLYENKKAKKEKVKAEREVSATRSQSRSRGHAMSPEGETRGPPAIEYGNDPITAGESHARPRSRADSYYSDHGQGGRRSPGSSSSESPRHRRYVSRSRSRGPDYAEGAAGTGVVGAAAHDASKRRERKRAEKERRRKYLHRSRVIGANKCKRSRTSSARDAAARRIRFWAIRTRAATHKPAACAA